MCEQSKYLSTHYSFRFILSTMEPGGSEAVVKPETPYKMPTHNDWTPLATTYHPLQAGSIDGTDTVPHDKGVVRAVLSRCEFLCTNG